VLIATGCNKQKSGAPAEQHRAGHVTFVQWSDPHLFDAGAARKREEIEEEQLDNWSALHWAVLQTNHLAKERQIDFVVLTGDFGLYNVEMDLPDLKKKDDSVQQEEG